MKLGLDATALIKLCRPQVDPRKTLEDSIAVLDLVILKGTEYSEQPEIIARDEATNNDIPCWNADTGKLQFRAKVAKEIKNRKLAVNVLKILQAFQEDGWPPRIDDPSPNGKDPERLNNTLASLNLKLQ